MLLAAKIAYICSQRLPAVLVPPAGARGKWGGLQHQSNPPYTHSLPRRRRHIQPAKYFPSSKMTTT